MANGNVTLVINRLQKDTGHLNITNRDGQPDTTTPLVASCDTPSVATVETDPEDPRAIHVTGLSPGVATGHVTCDLGVNGGVQSLSVNITIQDVNASSISATFDPPEPRL